MKSKVFDLETQLTFYKAYHNTTPNILIHSLFVPTILFTSLRILNEIHLFQEISLAHVLAFGFGLFYIMLNISTGMLASAVLALMCYAINTWHVLESLKQAWFLFFISWVWQFIGHGVFEKRKPALLDSLVQSLVLAPYFILYELLFLLGFMPVLRASLQKRVNDELLRLNNTHKE